MSLFHLICYSKWQGSLCVGLREREREREREGGERVCVHQRVRKSARVCFKATADMVIAIPPPPPVQFGAHLEALARSNLSESQHAYKKASIIIVGILSCSLRDTADCS